jgi:hypothetical protein
VAAAAALSALVVATPQPVAANDAQPPPVVPPASPSLGLGGRHSFRIITFVGVLGAVIAVALTLLDARQPQPSAAAPPVAALALDSEPRGAHILVDGEPTGLVTPAVLRTLRPGRVVEVRLDKPGYQAAVERIEVTAGGPGARSFSLVPASGTLRLEGLPPGATVYLDDVVIEARGPFAVPLGSHRLRVERGGAVVFETTAEARPGDQTVEIHTSSRGR